MTYGRDVEGRYRLLGEVIAAVRAEVGSDFPVLVKMNIDDGTPEPGMTPELAAAYAARMVQDGVDCLEISAGATIGAPFVMSRGEAHIEDFARHRAVAGQTTAGPRRRRHAAAAVRGGVQRCGHRPGEGRARGRSSGARGRHAVAVGDAGVRRRRHGRPRLDVPPAGARAGSDRQAQGRSGRSPGVHLLQPLPRGLLPRPPDPLLCERASEEARALLSGAFEDTKAQPTGGDVFKIVGRFEEGEDLGHGSGDQLALADRRTPDAAGVARVVCGGSLGVSRWLVAGSCVAGAHGTGGRNRLITGLPGLRRQGTTRQSTHAAPPLRSAPRRSNRGCVVLRAERRLLDESSGNRLRRSRR